MFTANDKWDSFEMKHSQSKFFAAWLHFGALVIYWFYGVFFYSGWVLFLISSIGLLHSLHGKLLFILPCWLYSKNSVKPIIDNILVVLVLIKCTKTICSFSLVFPKFGQLSKIYRLLQVNICIFSKYWKTGNDFVCSWDCIIFATLFQKF